MFSAICSDAAQDVGVCFYDAQLLLNTRRGYRRENRHSLGQKLLLHVASVLTSVSLVLEPVRDKSPLSQNTGQWQPGSHSQPSPGFSR